jgi:hypothetical protein
MIKPQVINYPLDPNAEALLMTQEGHQLLDNASQEMVESIIKNLPKGMIPITPDIIAIMVAAIVSSAPDPNKMLQAIADAITTRNIHHGYLTYSISIIQSNLGLLWEIQGHVLEPK